jgi:hypothetical protein
MGPFLVRMVGIYELKQTLQLVNSKVSCEKTAESRLYFLDLGFGS